jgi:hypothetical protein
MHPAQLIDLLTPNVRATLEEIYKTIVKSIKRKLAVEIDLEGLDTYLRFEQSKESFDLLENEALLLDKASKQKYKAAFVVSHFAYLAAAEDVRLSEISNSNGLEKIIFFPKGKTEKKCKGTACLKFGTAAFEA